MDKIGKLSPEMEDGLAEFRESRRARGLRLQWASEQEIRESVLDLYRCAGAKEPKAVVVLDSPAACLAAWSILKEPMKIADQLRGQLWGQLRGQLGGQLWGQLYDQLWDQLRGQLGGQLGDQLGDQLYDQLWDQLWGQLRDQLRGQLGDQLCNQTLWFSGGAEHYWTSFYRYGLLAGVKVEGRLSDWLFAWETYADTAGPLYPYQGIAFVSRRPTILKFNGERQLHSDKGPAMGFADGFGVYAWRGIRVPQEWVDSPQSVDPNDIIKTEDIEQRAAGAEIIGWDRMAAKMDRKIIDGDPETGLGALIELTLEGLNQPGRFLQAVCPRNGTIVEGVPRVSDIDNLPIETAIAAQAWRVGLPTDEHQHPKLRT